MIREETLLQARILVVDDEPANVRLIEQILTGSGYGNVTSTTDSTDVLGLFVKVQPDLLLLDLRMPKVDGFEIMERLGHLIPAESYVPILVLTADFATDVKKRALAGGAKDFLTKPFDYHEVLLRIHNLLTTRFLHLDLQRQNESLDDKVRERTRELARAQLETLERLARAAEYRDDDTGQHTRRVGEVSARVGRALELPQKQIKMLRLAAPLHDVGKISIPDSILLKPGKLTSEEWEVMKTHTTVGTQLLAGSQSALLRVGEVIALSHHEKWDGSGYPHGLSGEEIPLAARIVAVADVFDALSFDRPYRKAWPLQKVITEIIEQRGQHFDPQVVDAFLEDFSSGGRERIEALAATG